MTVSSTKPGTESGFNLSELIKGVDAAQAARGLPPVHLWDPPYCGEIEIEFAKTGRGSMAGRPLVAPVWCACFSTVLKRENQDYYLVTPVEKLKISVEDVPFVAVAARRSETDASRRVEFVTNVGDTVNLDNEHPLTMRSVPEGGRAPYIAVRAGLEARVNRSVYYELADWSDFEEIDGARAFGIWSDGVFFPLADKEELERM